jgi:hypothetical protein
LKKILNLTGISSQIFVYHSIVLLVKHGKILIADFKYKFCLQAAHPLPSDLLVALGFDKNDERITTAAVCVYPARVADAINSLKKLGVADKIPVASGTLLCTGNRKIPFTNTASVFTPNWFTFQEHYRLYLLKPNVFQQMTPKCYSLKLLLCL